jgi:hypothetical protein
VRAEQDPLPTMLLVASRFGVVERLAALLRPVAHRVEVACDLDHARAVALVRRFDAIVIAFADPPDELSRLTASIRRDQSLSRAAAVVLCCDVFSAEQGGQVLWPGVNRLLLMSDVEEKLLPTIERLLLVAPRVRATLPSRIELSGPGFSRRLFCQTVNVSASGMLLRVPHSLRPGTQLRFELFVSAASSPVRGQARVVRLARPDKEPFPAVGLAFTHLDLENQTRLVAHLQKLAA